MDGQRIGMLARALGERIRWWNWRWFWVQPISLPWSRRSQARGALIVYYLYRRGLKTSQATAVVLGGGLAGQSSLALLGLITSASLTNVPDDLSPYFRAVKIGALVYLTILMSLQVGIIKSDRLFQWLWSKRGRNRAQLLDH